MAGIAYSNAATTRLNSDWVTTPGDVNDEWAADARTLANRAWDLYRNNPLAAAMVETMVDGTFGDCGLEFRSLYAEDDATDTSEAELEVRRAINAYVARATAEMRPDAAGMMSWLDLHRALRISRRVAGEGFAIRVWKPNRVNARTATCWRLIDPARVCNPDYGANTQRMFEGFELDAEGAPVAIHVISSHQNLVRYAERKTWKRVPIYAPDGTRNVIHCRAPGRPDLVRGVSGFAPILGDLKHIDDTKLAYVVGKKANASIALIVNTKNPAAAAAADKHGAVLAGATGIKPLMRYYVGLEDKVNTFGFQFQGGEFDELLLALMQVDTATWRLPVEMVLARLTRTNMAASRSAMMLAFKTFRREQEEHIAQAYQPMIAALIREGVARGEIEVPADIDPDRLTAGRYLRPAVMWPDPLKEAQAAAAKIALGVAPSTVLGELGHSFEDEVMQSKQDHELAKAQGVKIGGAPAGGPGMPPPRGGAPAPAKGDEDEEQVDDEERDKEEPADEVDDEEEARA